MSETKSPRLLWLEKHRIVTHHHEDDDAPWFDASDESSHGLGATEDEAIIATHPEHYFTNFPTTGAL